MPRFHRIFTASAILASALCPPLTRATAQATSPPPTTANAAAIASRAALAGALLRLDYALLAHPPAVDAIAPLHRAFDQASLAFFGGRNAQALATMDSLTHVLTSDAAEAGRHAASADSALRAADANVRQLVVGTDTIPFRLFVPTNSRGRRPLLIAFHGAGGNEQMFALAYGAGALLRIAQQRDLVVAMPLTNAFTRNAPLKLDALIASVTAMASIDSAQILVLGHSMGGVVAGQLATSRGARVIAVACIASPCTGPADASTDMTGRRAPTLVFAAENDLLIPRARIEASVAQAVNSGRAVELRTVPNQGHTLVVPGVLPAAIDWLLKQHRP